MTTKLVKKQPGKVPALILARGARAGEAPAKLRGGSAMLFGGRRGPLTFKGLVERIRQTLAAGRARAEKAVDLEKARTYWETGRWIHIYELKGKDRARYGKHLIPNIAEKLHMSESLIHDTVLMYRSFPILHARGELTWAVYQRLLRVQNAAQRQALAKQAAEEKWKTRQVEAAVRKIRQKALPSPDLRKKGEKAARGNGKVLIRKLVPKKGKFFTYQIVQPHNMHRGPGGYSLDLGFRVRREIDFKGIRNPRPGQIVQVVRTKKDPAGDRYKVVRNANLKRPDLYTYKVKAKIFRDADTFWVDADLGFRNWSEQKLRLRGIDALELSEEGGRKAAAYVKKVLSSVPFIVITISGRDKFGRPLADVFYLPGTNDRDKVLAEGRFLNQELLDLGLAKRA